MYPFLHEGLRAGHKCLWAIDAADRDTFPTGAHSELDAARTDQLDIVLSSDVYFGRGDFSVPHMIDYWDGWASSSLAGGEFRFVRAVGEMTRAVIEVMGTANLVRYESELNRFAPRHRQVLLCPYDLDQVRGDLFFDILKTHPRVLTAVPSVGGCRAEGVHLDDDWRSVGSVGRPANAECLRAQLAALDRFGGALTVQGAAWAWAYPLTGLDEMAGHLVVSAENEPEPHHQFLLNVLAQQTGAALLNARLHARERASAARERAIADQLRAANLALERAMAELERSAAVQRSLDIHNRLTATASAGQGQDGIAWALHELTGLPVAIEDRHGNLTAWAGPGRPDPYPKPSPARREQTLRRGLDARGPVRDKGRLIALAQPGSEVLGIIALVDPDRTAGDSEKAALEHASLVTKIICSPPRR